MVAKNTKHEKLAQRLSIILQRLNSGEHLVIDDLCQEFQVDKRTLQRDLRERFAFLNLERVDNGVYRLDKRWLQQLDIDDIRRFAKFASISDLFEKIDRYFFEKYLTDSIKVKGFDYESIKGKQATFDKLLQAIEQNFQVTFNYKRVKNEQTNIAQDYVVNPYRLINKKGVWYLIATHDGVIKTFSFTRLFGLRVCSHNFLPDKAVNEKIDASDSIYFVGTIDEVVLKIAPEIAVYFTRRNILPNQEIVSELSEGTLLLMCKNVHKKEMLPQIRYWLPHIEIVSPNELRAEFVGQIQEYLSMLGDSVNR